MGCLHDKIFLRVLENVYPQALVNSEIITLFFFSDFNQSLSQSKTCFWKFMISFWQLLNLLDILNFTYHYWLRMCFFRICAEQIKVILWKIIIACSKPYYFCKTFKVLFSQQMQNIHMHIEWANYTPLCLQCLNCRMQGWRNNHGLNFYLLF